MSRDIFSRERRVRDPVKGLRQRLRVALRQAGVVGKFRTDHLRKNRHWDAPGGELLVITKDPSVHVPFSTFEGLPVSLLVVNESLEW